MDQKKFVFRHFHVVLVFIETAKKFLKRFYFHKGFQKTVENLKINCCNFPNTFQFI